MTTFGHYVARLFLFLLTSFAGPAGALIVVPNLPEEGVVSEDNRGAISPAIDYERFSGRVTDKDDSSRIFKIKVENNNTKFFRAGDLAMFKVNLQDNRNFCQAFVRSVEDFHFTVYVESLAPCFHPTDYFRRGTVLNFYSPVLGQRVFEATKFREQVIVRKEDFLRQLNDINHFLWTFDQQKVKVAANYDEEINRLQREKRKALDDLITLKQERVILQNELMRKLNELDGSLQYYRVERQELLTDRWNLDHDAALPVGRRPQQMKLELDRKRLETDL
jgi:hypothetical protein